MLSWSFLHEVMMSPRVCVERFLFPGLCILAAAAGPVLACTVTSTGAGNSDAGVITDSGNNQDVDTTIDAAAAQDSAIEAATITDGSSTDASDASDAEACSMVELPATANLTYQGSISTGGGPVGPFCTAGAELTYESIRFRFAGRRPLLSFTLPADVATALRTTSRVKTVELGFTVAQGGGSMGPCDQHLADGGVINLCVDDWFACPLKLGVVPEPEAGSECGALSPQFGTVAPPLCGSSVGFNFRDAADTPVKIALNVQSVKDELDGDVVTVGLQAGDDPADGLRANIHARTAAPTLQPKLRIKICAQ